MPYTLGLAQTETVKIPELESISDLKRFMSTAYDLSEGKGGNCSLGFIQTVH